MQQETAEIVQLIGSKIHGWRNIKKSDRLYMFYKLIEDLPSILSIKHASKELTIIMDSIGESIYLSIDGDLGVYYTDEEDTREPIRISLLARRTVIVTEVYSVDVPCFDTTTEEELIALSDGYDKEYITTRYKEDD